MLSGFRHRARGAGGKLKTLRLCKFRLAADREVGSEAPFPLPIMPEFLYFRLMPFADRLNGHQRLRSASDIMLFAEAWLSLGVAAIDLKLRPFERVMRCKPAPESGGAGNLDVGRLVWAVTAARRRSWLRAKCIESALALRAMLRRRHLASTLHYGVRNAPGEDLQAHVWLSVGGQIVIGDETAALFTEVVAFSAPAST